MNNQTNHRLFLLLAVSAAAVSLSARAQNECGPGPTVVCDQATYATGITYQTGVDLSLTKTNTGTTSVTANGINLTATGDAALDVDTRLGTVTGGAQTNGPIIDAVTAAGDINILTNTVSSSAANTTHVIRAISNEGGNIAIHADTSTGTSGSVLSMGSSQNFADGTAGLEAISRGGNGNVDIFLGRGLSARRQYGLRAEVEGSGNLSIITGYYQGAIFSKGVISMDRPDGLAAVYAKTETGLLTIEAIIGSQSTGAIIDAGGDFSFYGSAFSGAGFYGLDLLNVRAGTTSSVVLTDVTSIRAQGAGSLQIDIVDDPELGFSRTFTTLNFDVTGMSERVAVTVRDEGIWQPGVQTIQDGNFDITIGFDGLMVLNDAIDLTFASDSSVLTLADGSYMVVGEGGSSPRPTTATIEGLGEFRHAGRIVLGESSTTRKGLPGELSRKIGSTSHGAFVNAIDNARDDILRMPGVRWIGEQGEIWMDVELGVSQSSCERGADSLLPAGDCVILEGATTEGVTNLTLFDRFNFGRGRLNPAARDGIVLVEVTGGNSEQGHFVVGPNTPGYDPAFGGSWDRGLFQYIVSYDDSTQQHKLVGMLNDSAFQQAALAGTSHDLWRMAAGNWLGYQADRRETGQGLDQDVWLRTSRTSASRDQVTTEQAGGANFDFDHGFDRSDLTMTAGLDVLAGGDADGNWSLGVMLGYVTSSLRYTGENNSEFNGFNYGAYATFSSGGLWVDGVFNVNDLTMRQAIPGLRLNPVDTLVSSDLQTLGFQVDAGWRFQMSEALFVEPLAGLSYGKTRFEALKLVPDDTFEPGLSLEWDDPITQRASLGGRVGLDQTLLGLRTRFTLMARAWSELDGESNTSIANEAFPDDPELMVSDAFDGTFTELGLGASVKSANGLVTGFLNLGSQQGDDYSTVSASAGVRVSW